MHYFLSVLLYYKSNFRQTDHLHSRTPLCVARTRILLAMFGSQILFGSGEMSERHLVESSDRWNNMFTSIPSAISIWMLEEMSQIGSSPTRIWGNTLRPALTASRLFMIWRAPSSFPHTRAALLTIRCPQKKIVWGQNNFCW